VSSENSSFSPDELDALGTGELVRTSLFPSTAVPVAGESGRHS
jgi:hypothetical protein